MQTIYTPKRWYMVRSGGTYSGFQVANGGKVNTESRRHELLLEGYP